MAKIINYCNLWRQFAFAFECYQEVLPKIVFREFLRSEEKDERKQICVDGNDEAGPLLRDSERGFGIESLLVNVEQGTNMDYQGCTITEYVRHNQLCRSDIL